MSQGYYYQEPTAGFRPPDITWAVQRLILANIVIFAIQLLADPIVTTFFSGRAYHVLPGGPLNLWFGFQQDLFLTGWIYKPLTYQFLHSGLMHLFLNMLWLFFFGPEVERTLGTRQFFRFYLICGGLGVLFTLIPYMTGTILNPPDPGTVQNVGDIPRPTSVVGASGAVMGVMVAFAVIDPHRQFYLFPLPIPITAVGIVILVLVMQIVTSLQHTSISVATHLGGMGVGYAYMKLLPKFNRWMRNRGRAENRARRKWKMKKDGKSPEDKIAEAVDNIFQSRDDKD